MFLFGFWPSCAYQDCPFPAILEVRSLKDEDEIGVYLCPFHLGEGREALAEIKALRYEQEQEDIKLVELDQDQESP